MSRRDPEAEKVKQALKTVKDHVEGLRKLAKAFRAATRAVEGLIDALPPAPVPAENMPRPRICNDSLNRPVEDAGS